MLYSCMGFDKYVMSYIHHYSFVQSSFIALEIRCSSLIHPSLPPPKWCQPLIYSCLFLLESLLLLTVVLYFPECRVFSLFRLASFTCLFTFWRTSWLLSVITNKGIIGIQWLSDDREKPMTLNNCLLLTFPREGDTPCHAGPQGRHQVLISR